MRFILAFIIAASSLLAQSNKQQVMIQTGVDAPSTPTDSPGAGTYGSTQSVTLSDATAQFILYTTDGSTPACPSTGTLYSGAISVSATTTIKAIGCNGITGGGVLTSVYTIGSPPAFVQAVATDDGSTPGASITTGAITVTAGNGLAIWVGSHATGTTPTFAVSTSQGDTVTTISTLQGDTDLLLWSQWFCVSSAVGGSTTFTFTPSLTNKAYKHITAVEYTNPSGSCPDAHTDISGSNGYASAANTVTTAAWTTTAASEIEFIGGLTYAAGRTWTAGSGFTLAPNSSGTNKYGAVEYQVVSSIQTGVTGQFTISGAASYIHGQTTTYK